MMGASTSSLTSTSSRQDTRDRVELAAETRIDPPAEGAHPARLAKKAVDIVGLTVGQLGLTRQQAKVARFDDDAPIPGLRADGTVALEGTRTQINVRLHASGAT